jgi:hypothetical protein
MFFTIDNSMWFLSRKIIHSPCKSRSNRRAASALFLASRLTLAAVPALTITCVSGPSIERLAAMSVYYVPAPALERELVYGQFFGKKNFIKEILEQVDSIYRLSAPYALSVPTQLLPKDVTEILQKYLLPDKNKNYYSYVLDNVDRIIFCPKIIFKHQGKVLGAAMESLLDEYLYPAERLIYINSLHGESRRIMAEEVLSKTITIVHETAHRELFKLILELKLDRKYYQDKYNERYAEIIEETFCQYLLADPAYAHVRDIVRWRLKSCSTRIEDYNRQLGLALVDRTLLP